MAIWQFKFSLVPFSGMEKVYGRRPTHLPEYGAGDFSFSGEDSEHPDYWQGRDPGSIAEGRISHILPVMDSWSRDAVMYGDSEGDCIEVWGDEVNCALDMRNFSLKILSDILQIANDSGCALVVHGDGVVIPPDMNVVLGAIKSSGAYAFCISPVDFLRGKA